MNVEIGAEATLFPEKKYIYGIAVAVCCSSASRRQKIDFRTIQNKVLSIFS
jgi:hypothetical protein